jgi:hypothetical protein
VRLDALREGVNVMLLSPSLTSEHIIPQFDSGCL